jgi:hypothetical protein
MRRLKMMRKLMLLLAVVAVGVLFSGNAVWAQPEGYSSMGKGICGDPGVASIPSGQGCILLHQVGQGENLHVLAAYYYGDARAWRRIYKMNKKYVRNPNKIYAGQILKIEIPANWTPRFDLQEFLALEERRMEALKRGAHKPIREIRTREEVEPTVSVEILDDYLGEKAEKKADKKKGLELLERPKARPDDGEEL